MSRLVRVYCPECDGASADYRLPPCDYCLNQGHLDMDRNEDGTPPKVHRNGVPVKLWVDESRAIFENLRLNPLRLTYAHPR
jgi:hypothetical protein